MATRLAYDCKGSNAQWVRSNLPMPDIMFWYGTGSLGVPWTPAEQALFPQNIMVEIDQGGLGSPVAGAVILDVENGAWPVDVAVREAMSAQPRKTLYGSRSTLASCAAVGYQGDFWLAWPQWNGQAVPGWPGIRIIGVQDEWLQLYDRTTILVNDWPVIRQVVPPSGNMSVTVESRTSHMAITPEAGADHYVISYQATPTAQRVVLDRPAQLSPPGVIHLNNLTVPGAAGGILTCDAIVNGVPVRIGGRNLP